MSQLPQWSDQWPDQSDQSPKSDSPFLRLARSRRGLTVITIVTGVLIVALLGTLALVLSSNAQGTPAQMGQDGLSGQVGQITTAGAAQTATAGGAGNGTSSGGSTPTASGGSSGGGGAHPTSTPTLAGGATLPIPPGDIAAISACLLNPCVHQVANRVTLSGTSVGPAVASCPTGQIALSGGWSIPPQSGSVVSRSARSSAGSWGIYVRHMATVDVTAYAECLGNASGAVISERVAYTSVAPGAYDGTYSDCNTGELLVGGGFAAQAGMLVYKSNVYLPYRWVGSAYNFGTASGKLNVYAECLTYATAHSGQTAPAYSASEITPGSGGRVASPTCPSGMYVSGGGFIGPAGVFYDTAAEGSGATTAWAVYDYNTIDGQQSLLLSQAMCLGF